MKVNPEVTLLSSQSSTDKIDLLSSRYGDRGLKKIPRVQYIMNGIIFNFYWTELKKRLCLSGNRLSRFEFL